jgi:hypothetical protein
VTSLGTSMTCSCKNCLYDDIARTCTLSNLLNAARQKTCNVPTTTAGTQPGVGLTPPTATTTTTTTTAPSGEPAIGSSCSPDYDGVPTGCVNCTTATYCDSTGFAIGPCPTPGQLCYASLTGTYCAASNAGATGC